MKLTDKLTKNAIDVSLAAMKLAIENPWSSSLGSRAVSAVKGGGDVVVPLIAVLKTELIKMYRSSHNLVFPS